MINKVILIGRLTRDPELRKISDELSVTTFTLAVDNYTSKNKDQKTTSFIPIKAWNNQANLICKYVHKGSLIGIDGHILQHNYERKDGIKTSFIEVIVENIQFLDKKNNENVDNNKIGNNNNNDNENQDIDNDLNEDDFDDDSLPF